MVLVFIRPFIASSSPPSNIAVAVINFERADFPFATRISFVTSVPSVAPWERALAETLK